MRSEMSACRVNRCGGLKRLLFKMVDGGVNTVEKSISLFRNAVLGSFGGAFQPHLPPSLPGCFLQNRLSCRTRQSSKYCR